MKWTIESVCATIAIVVTLGGVGYSHVYGAGAAASAIQTALVHEGDQDKKLDSHDSRLGAQDMNAAREQQALKDIQSQLDRIEKKL